MSFEFQSYSGFKFYFPFFMSIVIYENECKAKENEMKTRDKIELQHINSVGKAISWSISSTFCVHYTVCAVQVRNFIVPVILFFSCFIIYFETRNVQIKISEAFKNTLYLNFVTF